MVELLFPAAEAPDDRRAGLGYAMVLTAALLFAVNGTVSKVILGSGLSSQRLTEARSTGAFLGLALGLLLVQPGALRVRARELPFLIFFGIAGVAFVQWFYFLAIHRLPIGIALLIEYVAPLLVALWARFVLHEHVRRRVWAALGLALTGLTLVVEVWNGLTLDGLGMLAGGAATFAYATYILGAEHGVKSRDPVSLTCYGFLFAALFWAILEPWWSFPAHSATATVSLQGHLGDWHLPVWALLAWLVVLGTIAPFGLVVASLRHIPATRAGIAGMLEPVAASVVAFLWLGESFGAIQLVGGAVVLAAIGLAQSAR